MPTFGAHMSVHGGLYRAVESALELGMETLQIFTKNNYQWPIGLLTDEEIKAFRRAIRGSGLKHVTVHDCYLINLASPDADLRDRSLNAFADEITRADSIGAKYLVTHPGAHKGDGETAGLKRVIAAFNEIHKRMPDHKVQILVELTAGQGTSLGYRFEHLAAILNGVKHPEKFGICFDTAHAVAAGYALWPAGEYEKTFHAFEEIVGIEQLKLFHANDSKKPVGSRVDRHEHIGRGFVGLGAFTRLVNDPRFRKHPMIMETPKHDVRAVPMDATNLATLRSLVEKPAGRRKS